MDKDNFFLATTFMYLLKIFQKRGNDAIYFPQIWQKVEFQYLGVILFMKLCTFVSLFVKLRQTNREIKIVCYQYKNVWTYGRSGYKMYGQAKRK